MFRIDLSSLEPGVHHITRTVEAEALEREAFDEAAGGDEHDVSESESGGTLNPVTEDVTFGPVQVEAVLDYQPDEALVTFQARTTATLTCDRTLRRFEKPLEGHYAILFAAPGRSAPDQSDDHDELRELPPGARHLDLTGAVRDTLLLAIPQRKVAPGAEDEEIDTVFGAPDRAEDEPADPRFEKLRTLRGNGSDDDDS
ncbi:MAG: hypothetical protein BRD47_04135 [Bacteroidetes bacterium QS_8_68_28]|nr:MAG: hypothetical protein BRD47_04135 [Bacteroidetes bacterium QS_8_68_28]